MDAPPPPPFDDAAIARIAAGIADHSLPKAEWTHAAHFAAALWLLRHTGPAATRAAMPGLIRAYNDSTGVANTDSSGYHETITQASLGAAAAALAAAQTAPLPAVLAGLLAGPHGTRDWLLAYWSRALLFSPRARLEWVAPDLAALPFGYPGD